MERILGVFAIPTTEFSQEPLVSWAVLLVVIFVVPILFERLRLPGLIGLLASGIILGPNCLNILRSEMPTIRLLSDIGLVYLMFVAGLEVDKSHYRRTRNRSWVFGSLTFIIPLLVGTLVGRVFDFDWNAAILIGSLFASHTLLADPIVRRLGVIDNEAVSVTIGATIFTDIGALLILAMCVAAHFQLSFLPLLGFFGLLITYSIVVLVGFQQAGKKFFQHSGDDERNQFLFVLLSVFLTTLGAQIIGVSNIIGAFLAGLAVNDALDAGPVREKVIFVGSVLFIPIFFVDLGLMLDLHDFLNLRTLGFTSLVIIGLITSKLLAAIIAKFFYHYNWSETLTMWSLSIPQVGETLAATLVGYQAGLLNATVLNTVIVLMLVTAVFGPWLTGRLAGNLTVVNHQPESAIVRHDSVTKVPFTLVVPVYNPRTEKYLIELAVLIAQHLHGRIVPLAIATAPAHLDTPELEMALHRSQQLLTKAVALARELGVEAEPLLRIDDALAQGISCASREQKASLIVMGWGKRTGLRARLFGNVIDRVLWSSHCPVAVTRLLDSPRKIQRILVPIENLTAEVLSPVRFAQILAEANQAQVTLLNVCDRHTSPSKIAWMQLQIGLLVAKLGLANPPEIEIMPHESVVQAILMAARLYDLVVLRSLPQRTSAGGLAISDVTTQLIGQLTCSIVMLGEPNSSKQHFFDIDPVVGLATSTLE